MPTICQLDQNKYNVRWIVLALLTCCQPLMLQKNHEIEWDIKAPHTLFNHKFQQSFDQYKNMVSADIPTKITLMIKDPANAPLVYLPSQDAAQNNHVNVARWHMKYIIEYTIEAPGSPARKGILKTQCSYQDQDDYGNIFIADRGYDKMISQMMQEIVIILNA